MAASLVVFNIFIDRRSLSPASRKSAFRLSMLSFLHFSPSDYAFLADNSMIPEDATISTIKRRKREKNSGEKVGIGEGSFVAGVPANFLRKRPGISFVPAPRFVPQRSI